MEKSLLSTLYWLSFAGHFNCLLISPIVFCVGLFVLFFLAYIHVSLPIVKVIFLVTIFGFCTLSFSTLQVFVLDLVSAPVLLNLLLVFVSILVLCHCPILSEI